MAQTVPSKNRSQTGELLGIVEWFGRSPVAGAILLAALALLAYLPALQAGFIWDDDAYVTQNQALPSLAGLGRIWFDATATPQYYPLVHTSFWLEYHAWGLRPFGFHLVNILLHGAGAIVLWRVLVFLKVPGAWLAAAIFALHPVEAESVAWITERKNVLSAVFYFASALLYLRFAESRDRGAAGRGCYLLALGLFVAALLSKTVACSLPAALLLVCWWKNGRLRRGDVLPLIPFFAAGLGLGLLTIWLEKNNVGATGPAWGLTFGQRILIAGHAAWFYLAKLVCPVSFSFNYPRWQVDVNSWQWLFPVAMGSLVAGLWLARRRIGRGPVAALLFFIGTLAPSLGFVNVYPFRYSFVADHFQYLAGVGVIVLAASGISRWPRSFGIGLLAVLGFLTWRQAGIYHDPETLWRDTLKKNPESWLAHNNLGLELEHQGKLDDAFDQYADARRIEPDYPEAYNNLGNLLLQRGHPDEAVENYRKAIAIAPDYTDALNSLGAVLGMKGNNAEAILYLRRALRLRPDYAKAHMNLGNILKMEGDLEGAVREYREALRLMPDDPSLHDNLGMVFIQQAKNEAAVEEFNAALRLNPEDSRARQQLQQLQK